MSPVRDVAPEFQRLQVQLRSLDAEIDQLTNQLRVAVLDGNDICAATLEVRLDVLTARRAGLAAELAALESAVVVDVRERRRHAAAERERRALVLAQAELYEG